MDYWIFYGTGKMPERVHHIELYHDLEICMQKKSYCLGTGNSVANYIPLDNYLIMLDEGFKFTL